MDFNYKYRLPATPPNLINQLNFPTKYQNIIQEDLMVTTNKQQQSCIIMYMDIMGTRNIHVWYLMCQSMREEKGPRTESTTNVMMLSACDVTILHVVGTATWSVNTYM